MIFTKNIYKWFTPALSRLYMSIVWRYANIVLSSFIVPMVPITDGVILIARYLLFVIIFVILLVFSLYTILNIFNSTSRINFKINISVGLPLLDISTRIHQHMDDLGQSQLAPLIYIRSFGPNKKPTDSFLLPYFLQPPLFNLFQCVFALALGQY